MRLINVKAFLAREELLREGKRVDRRIKVLEFHDDEATNYAILSHRWIGQEVSYDEVVELAKMDREERYEIRQRDGYRKILDSCEQTKKDGYEWLWVDTCCIDKRSSAELSEAINSMYRWYENSRVCYAYLHDVSGPSLPAKRDNGTYPNSKGFPEWFSRGWTLQEMIAPNDVRFFNKCWQPIGDKKTLAPTLTHITLVPEHVLIDGLSFNRPCVAQIMSWAADRTTTRVEDRAYSLLGLLDVNMPMLYGEGKKAFHRLQLEVIRVSNDQSVFAWSFSKGRIGSILADDPNLFRDCAQMELVGHEKFIQSLRESFPEEDLSSIDEDRFGVFPITNRGIQIWLFLTPCADLPSVFKAWLPCRCRPWGLPVSIDLALGESNYYRFATSPWETFPAKRTLQFRQVYLKYQDTPHRDATFEVDDNAITGNSLTYCGTYPSKRRKDTLKLTHTQSLYVKVYYDSQSDCRFSVAFGQFLGRDWIHFGCEQPLSTGDRQPWEAYARGEYRRMLARAPEDSLLMAEARSKGKRDGLVWVKHTSLPGSTWTVRTSCILWESSMNYGVRIDAFQDPDFSNVTGNWKCLDVDRNNDPNCDMQSFMIRDRPYSMWNQTEICVDGTSMRFFPAPSGTQLGDYGHFTDFGDFYREGNIFDFKQISSQEHSAPRQHRIYQKHGYNTNTDYVHVPWPFFCDSTITLYKPLGLSLPNNDSFNTFLASLSTQLINKYLITSVIQCETVLSIESCRPWSNYIGSFDSSKLDHTTPFCTFAKPFV
ncbi:heterokaryon incompatibility protein-domain-containing protein [Scleroderma yunnanense]